jgi:hypothetical protein
MDAVVGEGRRKGRKEQGKNRWSRRRQEWLVGGECCLSLLSIKEEPGCGHHEFCES